VSREDELFNRLNHGDEAALDDLIRMYYPEILRFCLWHTPDRQTAEDAVQETFLKAVGHMDDYAHRGKFRAFLYKIAANTCTDFWRRYNRPDACESEEYIEPGFHSIESDLNLMKMLSQLPEEQREVILLRYVHELKIREIAVILDQPLRTVQSRLRAALKLLEKSL
jgi:RNA polymerase sigma factor (sigma-70 family)